MSGKKTAAVGDRRSSHALDLFEKAVRALGKRDYARAREHFEALIEAHPDERDVLERARTYMALCARALDKRPSFRPKSFEEFLNYGVYLHNRGEFEEALKHLQQAAEIHPRNEHVLYCLAAAAARSGDTAAAIKALRSAIAANPETRAQARSDSDFDPIREEEEFVGLVHAQEA
jgi:tetratricopeptide (TPR) repeat protein